MSYVLRVIRVALMHDRLQCKFSGACIPADSVAIIS